MKAATAVKTGAHYGNQVVGVSLDKFGLKPRYSMYSDSGRLTGGEDGREYHPLETSAGRVTRES